MGKDFYIQPDAADPVLDPDAVLAIVRLHLGVVPQTLQLFSGSVLDNLT
ncbi:hypothetical protein IBE75_10810, partial [Francisella tularensis]|nr:hypothetical protein [Francisella tularensis]